MRIYPRTLVLFASKGSAYSDPIRTRHAKRSQRLRGNTKRHASHGSMCFSFPRLPAYIDILLVEAQ